MVISDSDEKKSPNISKDAGDLVIKKVIVWVLLLPMVLAASLQQNSSSLIVSLQTLQALLTSHCAEKLGIPLQIMFTMPYSPTQALPHPLANIQSSNADAQLTNYISYAMIEVLMWQGPGDIINRFREKCLDLDPVSLIWAPGMLQRLKVPHTCCWSPALIPKPKDWGPHISITCFYILNSASGYSPAPELQAFLDAGPAPVFIGFGSIVLDDPDAMTELIFEAARKTGQCVLLSKAEEAWVQTSFGFLIAFSCLGMYLMTGCSSTCHVSFTMVAQEPQLQEYGRSAICSSPLLCGSALLGIYGRTSRRWPDPIPHKQLTADRPADAIEFCLRPQCLESARELASKIAAERGADRGAQSFHQYLEVDRLRCTLALSRAHPGQVGSFRSLYFGERKSSGFS